jgi:hypothetical protein
MPTERSCYDKMHCNKMFKNRSGNDIKKGTNKSIVMVIRKLSLQSLPLANVNLLMQSPLIVPMCKLHNQKVQECTTKYCR